MHVCTRDCVVGNGCRSLGLGSFGIRSSGLTFTFTDRQTDRQEAGQLAGWTGQGAAGRPNLLACKSQVSHPHLPLAGTQVEVEAALKPLVDEGGEGRNLAQVGELPGNKGILPVLRVLLLPHGPLQGGETGGESESYFSGRQTGRETGRQTATSWWELVIQVVRQTD